MNIVNTLGRIFEGKCNCFKFKPVLMSLNPDLKRFLVVILLQYNMNSNIIDFEKILWSLKGPFCDGR
jgi:hypothetical protein